MRHDDRGGEEHQQQGAPGPFLQRRVQGGEGRLVLQQPEFQFPGAAEYAVEGVHADAAQGHQLHHRLEGDGEHQSGVFLAGGDVACAEEDGEQSDQGTEAEGHAVVHRLAGEDADGVGHRLDLQRQQGQHADDHDHGGQGAGPGTAEAEGEEVGERRELVGPGDPQDGVEQHRRQEEGARDAEVAGEEAVAVLVGQADRAIERPGAGIDAQGQGVGQRMADDPARHEAPVTEPGHAEQGQ
ncbi:hypothetical protein D9M69_352400 [compost metagenome]